jgi:hypothetical protein
MGLYASKRNYGYGQQLAFAGKQALKRYYGGGHYASVATHAFRFTHFAAWAKAQKIRDAQIIDQALLNAYGEHLRHTIQKNEIGAAYAQNLLSTVNVTLAALRGNETLKLSPSALVGERRNIRTEAPGGLERSQLQNALTRLQAARLFRAAALVGLAREFGLREREASLANLTRWQKEAAQYGKVNITEGTKGGRGHAMDRWVSVTETGALALQNALKARPNGSQNLLRPTESYSQFVKGELARGRSILKAAGIDCYHDLRAAFACERYQQLTGTAAPVLTGGRTVDRDTDQQARKIMTVELGHGRLDVLNAYIGGLRRV